MPQKVVDTNLLSCALLEDHPASKACENFIKSESKRRRLLTTPITPFEVYYVLWKVYGLEQREAFEKASLLFEAPLDFTIIDETHSREALKKCVQYGIEANDGLLLYACLHHGIPSLASDDQKLLEASQREGIYTQCPVNKNLREKMSIWEKEMLAERGLPRILYRIYHWLLGINRETAEKLREATSNLRQLP